MSVLTGVVVPAIILVAAVWVFLHQNISRNWKMLGFGSAAFVGVSVLLGRIDKPDAIPAALLGAAAMLGSALLRAGYAAAGNAMLDSMLECNPKLKEGFEKSPLLRRALKKRRF